MWVKFFLVIFIGQALPGLLFCQNYSVNRSSSSKSERLFATNLTSPEALPKNDYTINSDRFLLTAPKKSLNLHPFRYTKKQVNSPQWVKGSIVPFSLICAGVITKFSSPHSFLNENSIQQELISRFPNAKSPIDNYLQYAPLGAVFGLKALGIKSRSDFINLCVISAKAEFLMGAIVGGMKLGIKTPGRIENNGLSAMPSGHTAQAFVSATILDMEFRDTSPLISVAGYFIAASTGMYRMINDVHFASEVLIGAGIGILSAKVVYITHQYRWGKKRSAFLFPVIYQNGGGLTFSMSI
jgi:PAP2 superfamily